MKKLKLLMPFALFLIVFLFCLSSCLKYPEIEKKESGDFIYQIIESMNNDTYVRIMGLSEEGQKKEYIVIPKYIDGLEVKAIGRNTYDGKLYSENLKKVFIPFSPNWEMRYDAIIGPVETFILTNEITNDISICDDLYITSYHYSGDDAWNEVVPYEYRGKINCFFANVSYFYNYESAPNSGYYWIDNYQYGEKIEYIPDDPIRDGYIFCGWYKESECINEWDFDIDTLPDTIRNEESIILYQETKLYAKWGKE